MNYIQRIQMLMRKMHMMKMKKQMDILMLRAGEKLMMDSYTLNLESAGDPQNLLWKAPLLRSPLSLVCHQMLTIALLILRMKGCRYGIILYSMAGEGRWTPCDALGTIGHTPNRTLHWMNMTVLQLLQLHQVPHEKSCSLLQISFWINLFCFRLKLIVLHLAMTIH